MIGFYCGTMVLQERYRCVHGNVEYEKGIMPLASFRFYLVSVFCTLPDFIGGGRGRQHDSITDLAFL